MKNLTIALCIAALFASSCQETEIPTLSSPTAQYVSWTEGDWWVYERARYNYNDGDTTVFSVDTVFALGDTIINGETYRTLSNNIFQLWVPNSGRAYIRDSSGYVVNQNGRVLYSDVNFSDTLSSVHEPPFHHYFMMRQDPVPTVVPAGVFNTINCQMTAWVTGQSYSCTQDTLIHSDRQFAEGVGMVRMSSHYAAPGPCIDHVANLISYYVQ